MAALFKAWIYGRSFSVIVGSNPAVGTDISLLGVLSLRRAEHRPEPYRVWCV